MTSCVWLFLLMRPMNMAFYRTHKQIHSHVKHKGIHSTKVQIAKWNNRTEWYINIQCYITHTSYSENINIYINTYWAHRPLNICHTDCCWVRCLTVWKMVGSECCTMKDKCWQLLSEHTVVVPELTLPTIGFGKYLLSAAFASPNLPFLINTPTI